MRSHYVVSQDWLRSGFPQAGEHLTTFALKGSLRQFKYFVGSTYLVPFAGAAFLLGLYALWKKRSALQIVLLTLPFCLACAGAMLGVFPYGSSRHTAFLGILIAAGAAQGVSTLTRARILPVLMAAVFLIPIWIATAPEDSMAIPESRHRLQWMREAVQFLRANVAPGSVVVADRGTELMLAYYLGSNDYDETLTFPFRVRESGGLRIVSAPIFQFRDDMELREAVSQAQRVFRLEEPVWVAVGGVELLVKTPPSAVQPFSHAITIFRSSSQQP